MEKKKELALIFLLWDVPKGAALKNQCCKSHDRNISFYVAVNHTLILVFSKKNEVRKLILKSG